MTSETDGNESASKTPAGSHAASVAASRSGSVTGEAVSGTANASAAGSVKDDASHVSHSARSAGSDKPECSIKSGSAGEPDENGEPRDSEDAKSHASEFEGEVEIKNDIEALNKELEKIKVESPTFKIEVKDNFDAADFPESYRENSNKEKQVLLYAENFRLQFVHLYQDRKPLLLNPTNELGMEKFVSTTIRPTQLPFQELYNWDGAAEFVADYLNFMPLDPPYEIPTRLLSSMTVIRRQLGNCFEYSTLLCSLLLGAGYDAYVVSGYANKETCMMDETREICPLLKKKEEKKEEAKKKEQKKYTVKPPKDLRSKYELMMAARKEREEEEEEKRRREEEQRRQDELEKPPSDRLQGLRVHSWVLVLEGKREVAESFFIEPFTGLSQPLDTPNYLGIESLWNHTNYWVNMQDCAEGVKNMKYDLGDCTLFEFMFPSNDKPLLQIPDDEEPLDLDEDNEQDDVERHLDIPPSWTEPIHVSFKDFQMRCPQGKKTKLYKRAKLEKFAHYLMKDGLTTRLSAYEDREMSDLLHVKEFYKNRADKLHERHFNHINGWTTEHYHPGRPRCLKEHQYRSAAPGPESDRTMFFYHSARVDGLEKRVETPTSMTEHFRNRDDFLYYRYVEFGKRPKKFGPAEGGPSARPIIKMIEKYHRNTEKIANTDIAELIFLLMDDKIQITYHTEDDKVSASTREFIKPPNADEKGSILIMPSDSHTTYQVDVKKGETKQVQRYEMLLEMIAAEELCKERVRESEEEVQEILKDRIKEETTPELDISVYDTMRNEKAKKHREELERLEQEELKRRQEMELDYLAPFLAQIDDPKNITPHKANRLKEICMNDLKQRIIDKANLIQARFEKETAELHRKQTWYQQNQVSMQKDDEEEYLNYCGEAMFRIRILELRLSRHKENAPKRVAELWQKFQKDNRLN